MHVEDVVCVHGRAPGQADGFGESSGVISEHESQRHAGARPTIQLQEDEVLPAGNEPGSVVGDGLPADAAGHVVGAGSVPGLHRAEVYPVGRDPARSQL